MSHDAPVGHSVAGASPSHGPPGGRRASHVAVTNPRGAYAQIARMVPLMPSGPRSVRLAPLGGSGRFLPIQRPAACQYSRPEGSKWCRVASSRQALIQRSAVCASIPDAIRLARSIDRRCTLTGSARVSATQIGYLPLTQAACYMFPHSTFARWPPARGSFAVPCAPEYPDCSSPPGRSQPGEPDGGRRGSHSARHPKRPERPPPRGCSGRPYAMRPSANCSALWLPCAVRGFDGSR
jgi:hypothetical protein